MRGEKRDMVEVLKSGLKLCAAMAAMAVVMCIGSNNVVYADDVTGVDGGIKWTISGDILKIEAAGEKSTDGFDSGVMKDYEKLTTDEYPSAALSGKAPWSKDDSYNMVRRIEISNDVSNIGDRAFGRYEGKKDFDAVVIGSGVKSIGKFSFANTKIDELTIYSSVLTSCDENSFLSKKDGGKIDGMDDSLYNISKIVCYSGISTYIIGSNNSIPVTYFNLQITSDNLLSDNADVSIKFDGISDSQKADKVTDSPSINIAPLFDNNSMDVSKLKFFSLSQTDTNAPINKAVVSIPTPSDWKNNYDKIELYSYTVTDGALALTKLSPSVTADSISFTGEGFPVDYVMYYNYNENPEYKVLIDTQYFDNEVFYWGIAGSSLSYGIPTKTDTTISEIITKFVAANTANSSGYTFDNNKLKAFDLSLTTDGNAVTTAPSNMRVKIPVPSGWDASDVQVLTLSSDNKIEVLNGITVTYIGSKLYVDFMPSHFSPYALYNAKAGTETTTVAPTTAATTTAANNTTTRANTTTTTNINNSNNGSNYTGSGRYDNTPKTGVKDFMWIAIPVAVMLMGTGIVILGRRKQKSIDE